MRKKARKFNAAHNLANDPALTGRHGNAQSRWPRNSTFEVCSCRTPFERNLRRNMNLKSERDYTLLL